MTDLSQPDIDPKKNARRLAIRFFRLATGVLVASVSAISLAARFDFFGAGFHVNFALILGVAGTILLGVGLMALSFYSNRSGADDAVVNRDEAGWRERD